MSIGFLVTIFAVFGAVALGVGGLMQFVMTQTNFERRRLKEAKLAGATGVLLENQSLDPEQSKIAKQLSGIVPRSPKEMGKLRRKFVRAGYHIGHADRDLLARPARAARDFRLRASRVPADVAGLDDHDHLGLAGLPDPGLHPLADHDQAAEGHHQRSARSARPAHRLSRSGILARPGDRQGDRRARARVPAARGRISYVDYGNARRQTAPRSVQESGVTHGRRRCPGTGLDARSDR